MHTIFLSFSKTDKDTVSLIKGRALNSNYGKISFSTHDLLKPWETKDPSVVRQAISTNLRGTSKTIVFVGRDTYHSHWVAEEVKMTLEANKRVYAIAVDATGGPTPPILDHHRIQVHPWSEQQLQRLVSS